MISIPFPLSVMLKNSLTQASITGVNAHYRRTNKRKDGTQSDYPLVTNCKTQPWFSAIARRLVTEEFHAGSAVKWGCPILSGHLRGRQNSSLHINVAKQPKCMIKHTVLNLDFQSSMHILDTNFITLDFAQRHHQ